MSSSLLFPGQGAPAADWRDAVADATPELLAEARELLGGTDPFERFGQGTEYDQPAIYCASLAAYEIAGRPGAAYFAGHSLGEISALACAGVLSRLDGLRLVVRRGRLMADAAGRSGPGAMLAVRASASALEAGFDLAGVAIANLNSPSQTVLSGPARAIGEIRCRLEDAGLRCKELAVSGAFHSPAMEPAAAALAGFLAGIDVAEPRCQVISARTAQPFADVRAELPASLVEPVRWIDVVAELQRLGVTRYREIGPGKALGGLVRRCAGAEAEIETTPLPGVVGA